MKRLSIALNSVRRESEKGIGHAAQWFARRFHLRFIRRRWPALPPPTAEDLARPITVVVPAVEKDADVLDRCLAAARRYVQHPIEALWVVAPDSASIRALAARYGATWVHEDTLLPRPAKELKTRGWVLQQLIKFGAAASAPTPDYLVLDADTLFVRPQCFFRRGRTVLRYSDQYELLYNRSLQLVFGHPRRHPVSFVTHHSLFHRDRVRALLNFMETRFGMPWWQAILSEMDQGHLISFSEYELYGHFIVEQAGWRKAFLLEYWNGIDCQGEDLARLDEVLAHAGPRVNSISFHRHTQ